jgi:hypothetical protein
MRLLVALGCLLLVGCAGPHTTGGLWAEQNLDRELAMFRTGDAQRAAQARTYLASLADETLAAERSRIQTGLQDCPGSARQPLALSVGDRPRDIVRIRAQGDTARLAATAQIALADWRLRRAQATGEARFCDDARQALSASAVESAASDPLVNAGTAAPDQPPNVGTPATSDLLASAGTATVTRDPGHPSVPSETWAPDVTLSNYAMGYIDTVQAPAPLPQYLAAVYGGVLVGSPTPPGLNGQTAAELVDRLAPAYPAWEPDALYATFSTSTSTSQP